MIPFFKDSGLLGMNRRNADYILKQNPRRLYPLVDDKLKTKQILELHEIPTPELYFTIGHNFELQKLEDLKRYHEFVIKPARGAEGRGIVVIQDRTDAGWKKSSGEVLKREDIDYHVLNILAGLYSLGGVDDQAFVEYCVKSHHVFRQVAFRGVPDIRVILYRGVPVMSMLRLPTRESDGKANLHQGAVGAGVDLVKGMTRGGVHHNHLVDRHPDTGAIIGGLRIPFWEDILGIAARTYDVFKLGYFGVDFVIDHILGPLILELNARPGLNIQMANRQGLQPCLDQIDAYGGGETLSVDERLEMARKIAAAFNPA